MATSSYEIFNENENEIEINNELKSCNSQDNE